MSPDSASPPSRRRNRWPIAVLLVLLLVAGIIVWVQVFQPDPADAAGCNAPTPATSTASTAPRTGTAGTPGPASPAASGSGTPSGNSASSSSVSTSLGEFTEPSSLAGTRPADPGRVPVRVLNASAVTGEARTVTEELRSAGFSAIRQQENDPLYPNWDLRCYGEIRYGYAGLAEARTVLMVAPCAQLVLDDRLDNSVDLSLGKRYQVEPISDEVRAQLTKIANAAAPPPVIEGQTVSVRSIPPIPPLPDRSDCPA